MAKTIKFNLICDGKPIRTIEDLQNNFSVEDILAYYDNKLLHRWLEVRGYEKELEKVNTISESKNIDVIRKLIEIFEVETDSRNVDETVYFLDYFNEREELLSIYKEEKTKVDDIIDDYHTGYVQLERRIIDNPNDIAIIKSTIMELVNNYFWMFQYDFRRLFYNFLEYAPVAIFVLLTIEKCRNYYLPIEFKASRQNTVNTDTEGKTIEHGDCSMDYSEGEESSSESESAKASTLFGANSVKTRVQQEIFGRKVEFSVTSSASASECKSNESKATDKPKYDIDLPENSDKKRMYTKICELMDEKQLSEILKENLKKFSGLTDGYWKDLEPSGKKYLILSMNSGDYIRSAGKSGGDLKYTDVKNNFVILDGIDFKCNTTTHKLLYMEV